MAVMRNEAGNGKADGEDMKHSLKIGALKAAAHYCTFTVIAASAAVIAGCTSSSAVSGRSSEYTQTMARPIAADTYPVIEGKLPAANVQMSNDEAADISARLTALSGKRKSGEISEAEYQRRLKELQALAANHGADTLKEIQN